MNSYTEPKQTDRKPELFRLATSFRTDLINLEAKYEHLKTKHSSLQRESARDELHLVTATNYLEKKIEAHEAEVIRSAETHMDLLAKYAIALEALIGTTDIELAKVSYADEPDFSFEGRPGYEPEMGS